MRLRLAFENGIVSGTGTDVDGSFAFRGTYKGIAVDMLKAYPEIVVRYRGRWDGTVIAGAWRLSYDGNTDGGPFEIWPEGDEMAIADFMALDEVEEVPFELPPLERPLALPGRA